MAELTDLIIRDCCECDRPEKYDVDTVELRVSDLRLIIDRHLAGLLPSSYYMDPPDGGDVSVSEQLVRMAADAAAYRALSATGAEDAELRKKAARYDFLRSSPWDWQVEHLRSGWATYYGGKNLDAAIDAAIQSSGAAGDGEVSHGE